VLQRHSDPAPARNAAGGGDVRPATIERQFAELAGARR
jgi:hypothetical protein